MHKYALNSIALNHEGKKFGKGELTNLYCNPFSSIAFINLDKYISAPPKVVFLEVALTK